MSLARINTNVDAIFAQNSIRSLENSIATAMKRISSGRRINVAADDPTGIAILTNARAQLGSHRTAQQNNEETYSMLSVADAAMGQMENVLVEMRSVTLRGGNDATLTAAQLADLSSQYTDLAGMINSLNTNTKWGSKTLLTGGLKTVAIQYGAYSADKVSGNLLGTATKCSFTTIGGAAAAAFTKASKALAEMAKVDVAIGKVADIHAEIGRYMKVCEQGLETQLAMEIAVAETVTAVGDANLATEISSLARDSVLAQSATAILAQANIQAQSMLSLLGQ